MLRCIDEFWRSIETNKELNRKKLERAANESAIQALQASMESGKAELSTVCDKLITFGTVWATVCPLPIFRPHTRIDLQLHKNQIRGDLQAIEEKLDTANDTSSQEVISQLRVYDFYGTNIVLKLFQARLATARRVYGKLGKALRQYQIVASAGPGKVR